MTDDCRPDRELSLAASIPLKSRNLTVLQSADPFRYYEMIEQTSRTAREFCRRSGAQYELFLGVKRGFWFWQATYNRIALLNELYDRGFRNWVMYLDADAYVADLDFDINAYLLRHAQMSAILVPSGVSPNFWDVNDGVMLLNLGQPGGVDILARWTEAFAGLSDDFLLAHQQPFSCTGSQALLQNILKNNPDLWSSIHLASQELMNSDFASFIRQNLRAHNPDLQSRTNAIRESVDLVISSDAPDQKPQNEKLIGAAYLALLGRAADETGLRAYSRHLEALGTEQGLFKILRSILSSDEYSASLLERSPGGVTPDGARNHG